MYFINYFSASLEYYNKNSERDCSWISGPTLTVQDLQQMLKSKQEFLVPGFAYLYLYHGIWFFDKPGEENPKHMEFTPLYIMLGNNDHKYNSLKTSLLQDKRYTDYTIKASDDYINDENRYYICDINTNKKIITLDDLPVKAIIDPVSMEQTIPTLPTNKGQVAPVLTNFLKPVAELNLIPQEKQLEFVKNCAQFGSWVKRQTGNVK